MTFFELGTAEVIIRHFHLRFDMAAEWVAFVITALQASVLATRLQTDLSRGLQRAASSMYGEPGDEDGE